MILARRAEDPVADGQRIRSALSRFIGGGYVLYFLVCLPEMSSDAAIVASWWTPLAVLCAFVPGWLMLAVTFTRSPPAAIAVLAAACGLGYLTALALWFVAWNGDTLTADRATWLVLFPGLASLALVVGPRPQLAGLHLVVAMVAGYTANHLTDPSPESIWIALSGVVWAIAFSAVFVAAGAMAVRTGDVLDVSREHAYRTAADAAAQQARDSERARYDALVHDRVLAVLLSAASDGSDNRELARRAVDVMRELEATIDPSDDPVDVRELAGIVEAALGDSAPVPITGQEPAGANVAIPGSVAHALGNAAAEAVRNSTRHGGPDTGISVTIEASGSAVTVTILDTGRGFDPTTVPPDRMGVAVSIRDRMAAVGGRAVVASNPGHGTRVTLTWSTP